MKGFILCCWAIVFAVFLLSIGISHAGYNRDNWKHWSDFDKDCINTRHEVLILHGKDIVMDKCYVKSGLWVCPYTGKKFTDPRQMDVDHVVPLYNAYKSGAESWTKEQKEAFANDMENLLPVDATANRTKSADSPDLWKPPLMSYWKEYALKWIYIKQKYGLTYTTKEMKALAYMLYVGD